MGCCTNKEYVQVYILNGVLEMAGKSLFCPGSVQVEDDL